MTDPALAPEQSSARILLVDDDLSLLRLLTIRLQSEGYTVVPVDSPGSALAEMRRQAPDLMLTDLRMEEMSGMDLFREAKKIIPGLPVIMLTAHGTIPEAVEATREGLFAFLTKPVDKALLSTIEQALGQTQGNFSANWCEDMSTSNPVMIKLLDRARMAARSNVSILVQGESGTGKEVLARAIHSASTRADYPFVTINCGALPEQLLESELFGHVKGAFTGALRDHLGLLRAAEGGTLFLDEIGDMPLPLQVKLLRALQDKAVRPVGAIHDIQVDVRIISATHQDLEKAMEEGTFRQDLYYRLNVVNFVLPPLRERPEDIPGLVNHLLSERVDSREGFVKGFAPEAMTELCKASWPGNIRQLINVIEQCVALTPSPLIALEQVSEALSQPSSTLPTFNEARAEFEAHYLHKVLSITAGNVTEASRLAGRNRTDFYKLLSRYDIDPNTFKA